MKRFSIALSALLPLVVATAVMGQTISQGTTTNGFIKGSGHDFSQAKYTWSGGEICKPCHTPHNAVHPEVSTRIWAHELSVNSYQTAYTGGVDSGGNPINIATPTIGALDNYSRLCMGCHDGTVAVDSFAGAPGTGGGVMGVAAGTTAAMNLGTDLSKDHPVGIDAKYTNLNAGTASTGTLTNTSSSMQLAVWSPSRNTYQIGTGSQKLSLVNVSGAADGTGDFVVGCGTCHNPHGTGTTTDNSGRYQHLLRKDNTASALCLTCHKK